jgi:hypothetical protein
MRGRNYSVDRDLWKSPNCGWTTPQRVLGGLFVGLTMLIAQPNTAVAQVSPDNTHLIDVQAGSGHSRKVRDVSSGGYNLSGGAPVSLQDWYSSNWTDIQLTWMTEVKPNLGLFWGFSTGESGQKYQIDPAFKIGFLMQTKLSRRSILSLSATAIIGGMLTEKTCTADYGAIGGVQTVNCRLAATALPPAATLSYLFNDAPADRVEVNLQYQFKF